MDDVCSDDDHKEHMNVSGHCLDLDEKSFRAKSPVPEIRVNFRSVDQEKVVSRTRNQVDSKFLNK